MNKLDQNIISSLKYFEVKELLRSIEDLYERKYCQMMERGSQFKLELADDPNHIKILELFKGEWIWFASISNCKSFYSAYLSIVRERKLNKIVKNEK